MLETPTGTKLADHTVCAVEKLTLAIYLGATAGRHCATHHPLGNEATAGDWDLGRENFLSLMSITDHLTVNPHRPSGDLTMRPGAGGHRAHREAVLQETIGPPRSCGSSP